MCVWCPRCFFCILTVDTHCHTFLPIMLIISLTDAVFHNIFNEYLHKLCKWACNIIVSTLYPHHSFLSKCKFFHYHVLISLNYNLITFYLKISKVIHKFEVTPLYGTRYSTVNVLFSTFWTFISFCRFVHFLPTVSYEYYLWIKYMWMLVLRY